MLVVILCVLIFGIGVGWSLGAGFGYWLGQRTFYRPIIKLAQRYELLRAQKERFKDTLLKMEYAYTNKDCQETHPFEIEALEEFKEVLRIEERHLMIEELLRKNVLGKKAGYKPK